MEMSSISLLLPFSSSPVNETKWVLIQSRTKPRKAPQSNLKWDIFLPNIKNPLETANWTTAQVELWE